MDEGPSHTAVPRGTDSEQLIVAVSSTTRPELPAVRLERRQVTMTRSPSRVPCIVTITASEEAAANSAAITTTAAAATTVLAASSCATATRTTSTTSVATTPTTTTTTTHQDGSSSAGPPGPLGEESRARTSAAVLAPGPRGGAASPVTSLPPPSPGVQRRSSAHVMEFFEQQEKSLQEQFLALPARRPRKTRSPSPSIGGGSGRQSVGLDHLDNLVRLMEQLSLLRDENIRLRRRCSYLENTKHLLRYRVEDQPPQDSSGRRHRSKSAALHKSYTDPERRTRRRYVSEGEGDAEGEDLVESVSDQTPKRPKPGALKKRSFSTGSLEVPSELLDEGPGVTEPSQEAAHVSALLAPKTPPVKRKSKQTRWSRMKQVLSKQKFYEDIGFTFRSLRDFGRSSYFRYGPASGARGGGDVSPSTPRVSGNRSLDSGVSTSLDVDAQGMSCSGDGSTPGRLSQLADEKEEDAELSTEIWMGPQEWWDRYEAERGSLPRRQSSPSLTYKDEQGAGDKLGQEELAKLHRSSSYKESEEDAAPRDEGAGAAGGLVKHHESKKLKTAWGRVKDIIHTRKDSTKKRSSKKEKGGEGADGSRSEEPSEVDMEALLEEQLRGEHFGVGVISRSTPKTSPIAARQRASLAGSDSPPSAAGSPQKSPASPELKSPTDVSLLLAGGLSHEFSKKMLDWEEKKGKKSSISARGAGAEGEDPLRLDYPDIPSLPEHLAPSGRPEMDEPSLAESTSEETQVPSMAIVDLRRGMTDSFSRKMTEWERRKYRGGSTKEPASSPDPSRRSSKFRKDDRQRSKKSREEKEKEKLEKQREKEMQKVERQQLKLERDKLRIEKERLRALEREAKLEKMKGRLSQSDFDPSFRDPITGPLAEYKITADFAHKLHEWELRKGLSHDISTAIYLEAQKRHLIRLQASPYQEAEGEGEGEQPPTPAPRGQKPPPLTLQPYWDSPENTSPLEKSTETSIGDDTSITEECLTKSNISSLERANEQLLEELKRKELEYNTLQGEVNVLNDKLARFKEQAQLMVQYKMQLSPTQALGAEAKPPNVSMADLEERLMQLETFGEKLATSIESAAIGKWNTIEGEENVNIQLMELVVQMKKMLEEASQTEEASQKSTALSNFETLYRQAMQLQIQLNNLRLSHLERNKEIMDIKRQLLLQEVNNLLLQADIAQRESELSQYKESRRPGRVRRWNTFSGADVSPRQAREDREKAVPRLQLDRSPADTEPPDKVSPGSGPLSAPLPSLSPSSPLPFRRSAAHSTAPFDQPPSPFPSPLPSRRSPAAVASVEVAAAAATAGLLAAPSLSGPREVARGSPTSAHVAHRTDVASGSSSAVLPEKPSPATETPASSIPAAQPADAAIAGGTEKPRLTKTARVVEEDVGEEPSALLFLATASSQPGPLFGVGVSDRDVHTSTTTTRDISTRTGADLIVSESEEQDEEESRLRLQMKPGPDETVLPSSQTLRRHAPPEGPQPTAARTPRETTTISAKEEDDDYADDDKGARRKPSDETAMSTASGSTTSTSRTTTATTTTTTSRTPESSSDIAPAPAIGTLASTPPGPPQKLAPLSIVAPHFEFPASVEASTSICEKRNTVHETEARKLVLRKTPSPTFHLPHVGLVTARRRIRPPPELLQESRRYRSGHSAATTRIMQRYRVMADGSRISQEKLDASSSSHDKENISTISIAASYYGARVPRAASSEGAPPPAREQLSLSLDAATAASKLSSPSGPKAPFTSTAPLKDRTNGGSSGGRRPGEPAQPSPPRERTLSDSEVVARVPTEAYQRLSLNLEGRDPSPPPQPLLGQPSPGPPPPASSSPAPSPGYQKPDSTIRSGNHSSMPALPSSSSSSSRAHQDSGPEDQGARGVARATAGPSPLARKAEVSGAESVGVRGGVPPPSSPPPTPRARAKTVPGPSLPQGGAASPSALPPRPRTDPPTSPRLARAAGRALTSPKLPRGRRKLGTIGVLCQQSMSFDLGVSLQASALQETQAGRQPAQSSGRHRPKSSSSSRPSSTSSEPGAASPTTPTSPTQAPAPPAPAPGGQGGRHRGRLLDSSWLQKPKKFFKVSK